MTAEKRSIRTATFFEQVKAALLHYDDPQWLGVHSPLAAPYFLGAALHGVPPLASERGEALIRVIEKTLASLWGGPLPTTGEELRDGVAAESAPQGQGERYLCLILELNYRRRSYRPAPKSQAEIYNDILHISRPTHDRHLARAVEQLAALLLQRLRPTLRPEQPAPPPTLIGRDTLLATLLNELERGQCISLTGPGGVGKSSLGAAITERWRAPAVFWFTFRPSFNDQLDSLLFALGHFLHEHGASTLWQQLIANGGRLQDSNLALGLARSDLAALPHQPLLCFDELDFLRPLTADQPNPHHVQLLEFIDSLRTHIPLLLIGQRAFWESDVVHTIEALTPTQLAALIAHWSIPATAEDLARLHSYTGGNPRLVELCGALYWTNPHESFHEVLDQLPQTPALLPLWHRLERRLPANERRLLQTLAVFRTPAPADAWGETATEEAAAIRQLVERRLVYQDEQGGVTLLPALRQVIYAEVPVEVREQHHLRAASIRAARGDYTAAAYHLHQADQPEAAVALWYPQRKTEINRGQGSAALAIFAQISQRRLSKRQAQELALLRGELYELTGQPEKVVATVAAQSWPAEEPASINAQILWGNALRYQGQVDAALDKYQEGLALQRRLAGQAIQLHTLRSRTYLQQREMQQARQEVALARFQVESLQGAFHDLSGNYALAHDHYQRALTIAQEMNDTSARAQIHHHLALLMGRQAGMAEAGEHYAAAMALYQQSGDRYRVELVRSNLASTQIQARDFAAALEAAQMALRFFESMGDSVRIAQNASNVAEALVELDQLAEAEEYAQRVLTQEEPHSHPYALYTMGTIRRKERNLAEAELYYAQARHIAELNEDPFLLAYAWEALGEIYSEGGNRAAAQEALAQAAAGFRNLGIAEKIAHVAGLQQALATPTAPTT
ncbi:MAG: hypothetical protein R3C14_31250 [Caldilineaceae bacterium]